MKPQIELAQGPDLETFRAAGDAEVSAREGEALAANLTSIVSLAFNRFVFRENSNPGRVLEQSVAISRPPGAGFFTMISTFSGSYTTSDFRFLTERPLGQFLVSVGLRGNLLVCTVRLTDSNSDDPIAIVVDATVVFFN